MKQKQTSKKVDAALSLDVIQAGDSTRAYITSIDVQGKLVMASGGTDYAPIVLASTDGRTFHRRSAPAAGGLRGIRMLADGSAWVVGEFGTIARSTDRGATWIPSKNDRPPCLWDIIIDDSDGSFWIAGDEGLVLRSKDKGKSWQKVKVADPLRPRDQRADPTIERLPAGIFFTLFAGLWDGKKFIKPRGFKATDKLCASASTPEGDVALAVGDKGAAFRSTDGGLTFKRIATGFTAHLEDVAFVAGSFVAVGADGTIVRVSIDGERIAKIASKTKKHLWAIGSWGSGAIIGGEGKLLLRLSTKDDTYWRDADDDFAVRVRPVAGFVPFKKPSAEEVEKRHRSLLADAIAEHEKLPRPKKGRSNAPSAADEVALDRSIVSDPDDAANFAVYTDLLQSRSDPRGELAALTEDEPVMRDDGATPPKLGKEASAILKRHRAALLGRLADHRDPKEAEIALGWRYGFIFSASVRATQINFDEEKKSKVPRIVGELLEEASARYLRELRVGVVNHWEDSHQEIVRLIAMRSLPTLRGLWLGEENEEVFDWGSLGDPSPICASVERLERLSLCFGMMKLGHLVLPHLRELVINARTRLDRASLKAIGAASLPSLETLMVSFGPPDDDRGVTRKDIEDLIAAAEVRFPCLTRLGLLNCSESNEIIEALASSKLIAQLRELDLSGGTLSDEGAAMILNYAPAFARLESINVTDNYVSTRFLTQLSGLGGPTIESTLQRDDPGRDDRVPSVVE